MTGATTGRRPALDAAGTPRVRHDVFAGREPSYLGGILQFAGGMQARLLDLVFRGVAGKRPLSPHCITNNDKEHIENEFRLPSLGTQAPICAIRSFLYVS